MAVRCVGALAAVAMAACVLVSGSARAYTVKETDAGSTVRWHAGTVTLRIDPSMDRYFADFGVDALVRDAAGAWEGLSGVPELLVSEGVPGPRGFDAKRGADNGVYLVKDWQLAESSLAVTVATFESKSGKIVDTDILVNANHAFGVMPDGPDARGRAFDLRGVLTHEMGHVLGLGESFDVRMATMWPNIARGETHQRDISEDDETGAELAYAYLPLADSEEAGGCGSSSVVVRRSHQGPVGFWFLTGGLMIVTGLWLRSRARRGAPRGVPMLAFVVLFGAGGVPNGQGEAESERVEVVRTLALRRLPVEQRRVELAKRLASPSRKVRMAAAAVLERVGSREDSALASRLAQDPDAEVRRMGRLTLASLRTAPPAARLRAEEPEAQERLAHLVRGAREFVSGEAVSAGVSMRGGLMWSRYLVHGDQKVVEVEIPGGSLGEFTQVVSEQEAPNDGDPLVVALREGAAPAWAHLRDGVVYGGFVGEGPGIEWRAP